jgi:hypothetical protein
MPEAWLLVSRGEAQPEAVAKAKLKAMVYKSQHPTPAVAQRVIREALQTVHLDTLAKVAPSFAQFAAQVRSWTAASAAWSP